MQLSGTAQETVTLIIGSTINVCITISIQKYCGMQNNGIPPIVVLW